MYSIVLLILCLSFPGIVLSDYNCTTPNTLITFDDLPAVSEAGLVPNNYFDLTWSNVAYIYVRYLNSFGGNHTTLSSDVYVAFNNAGNSMTISSPAASTFSINSFIAAAFWHDNLTLSMHGKRNGATIYRQKVTLQANIASLIVLNWTDVDSINFTSSRGILDPMFSGAGNGSQFSMDNLCVDIQQSSKNMVFLFRSSFYIPTLYPITATPTTLVVTNDNSQTAIIVSVVLGITILILVVGIGVWYYIHSSRRS
ncbi:unnamed protein product [Adineta steineri]|uniref:Uncharacterized protein n=1 Tax=Adineta steineri TaxID=433720 RepID=A0A814QWH0_9BILA|nr:unnamed protein product [Adineta steineri]CAF1124668.1 unnamed protein product [Adineta steineri]